MIALDNMVCQLDTDVAESQPTRKAEVGMKDIDRITWTICDPLAFKILKDEWRDDRTWCDINYDD